MNRTQLTTLCVAAACFVAVGVSATTLASSVSSDPADALDPDYEAIPMAGDDVSQLESDVAANAEGDESDSENGGSGSGASDDADAARSNPATGASSSESAAAERARDSSGESQNSGGSTSGGSDQSDGGGSSLFGGLGLFADQFLTLLDVVTLLVGAALVIAILVLLYRYRDHLDLLLPRDEPLDAPEDGEPLDRRGPPPEANLVYAAWDSLIRDLDVEDPHTLTARECSRLAGDTGFDRDAVERLRSAFEDVRYGGRPVTDDRRQRVRDVCRRLDLTRNGDSP